MTEETVFLPIAYNPGKITFEEWVEQGLRLRNMAKVLPFLIGDWLNYGETKWGERYSQALDHFDGLTPRTLMQYSYVARQIKPNNRFEALSFRHHDAVASLSAKMQRQLLILARDTGLTSGDLRQKVKELTKDEDQERKAKPEKLCPWCGKDINKGP